MRPTLRKGSKGDDVVYLQQRLIRHGHDLSPYGADGDFGGGTYDAVRQFQASRNLGADGIVGKNTWTALDDEGEGTADTVTEAPTSEKDKLLAMVPADTISAVRRAALVAAINDLGKSEQGSSNWSPEIAHLVDGYNEYWKTGSSTRYPWCAMACSTWIGVGLGLGTSSTTIDWAKHPFKKYFGGAAQIEDWAKKNGGFVEGSGTPPAGGCFTMARGGSGSDTGGSAAKAGHVGLIVCDNGDGTFTTVEGNVSNKVKSYRRKKADVIGYEKWWV
jgi:peptidoglycan hydrolase-like protein with peptidoglycan-binding domain